jgi:hypothetical protein
MMMDDAGPEREVPAFQIGGKAMHTQVRVALAIALGIAVQTGPMWGGSSAGATEGDAWWRPEADFRPIRPWHFDGVDDLCWLWLPARICAAEGIVVLGPDVDRRILPWLRLEVLPVDLRWFRPWLLDALSPERTVTLVISSEELWSGQHDRLIEEVIDRGGAVLLIHPTLDDAERLDQLAGLSGTAWDDGEHEALLYGVRNALDDDGRAHETNFVLLRGSEDGFGGGRRPWFRSRLNEDETAWLLERIGRNPPVTRRAASIPGAQASCEGVDPQSCINELANAKHTSAKLSGGINNVDSQQVDNYIYSARSFINQEDLYYVAQEGQYVPGNCIGLAFILFVGVNNEGASVPISTVTQPSPGSTQETTQVTSGVSFALGGQAGYQGGGAFNVAPSLTFSHSKTTTVPPVEVSNITDIVSAAPRWVFGTSDSDAGEDNDYTTAWIWTVNLDDYTSATQRFDFVTTSEMANSWCSPGGFVLTLRSSVDQPFPTKTVEAPVVTSLTGSPVTAGQQFQIHGTAFYPSLVQNVLLGGNAVPSANISTTSDTVITVTAPNDPTHFPLNTPLAVAVRTSAGTSNADQTVTIR